MKTKEQGQTPFRHRVHYTRLGDSRFYGHLELLQLVFRVLRRTGLPVLFSQGYNPSPRVSFSQALPVGVESLVEHFDVDLERPVIDLRTAGAALNREFPETIRVTGIELVSKEQQVDRKVTYEIELPPDAGAGIGERINAFLFAEEFIIERVRKRKRKKLDIRPLVQSIQDNGDHIEIVLIQRHSQAGISPVLLLEKVFALTTEQARTARIKKVAVEDL